MSPEDEELRLDDKFHDECGLFGIWNHAEASNVAYLGLYALQHRGQESAGIAATDGQAFHVEKAMGWVADVFSRDRLRRLPGHRAIGHVRYSTAGSSTCATPSPSPRPRATGRSRSRTTAT
jgi:amidophosphoribosyltransferase